VRYHTKPVEGFHGQETLEKNPAALPVRDRWREITDTSWLRITGTVTDTKPVPVFPSSGAQRTGTAGTRDITYRRNPSQYPGRWLFLTL
jgi:hypothetical protein